jgi:hypothetical protein
MGTYQPDVNATNPWERHRASLVETRWSTCVDFSTGEDLIRAQSGFGFSEARSEWAWPIMTAGASRQIVGIWVMRYDARTGDLMTSIEKP